MSSSDSVSVPSTPVSNSGPSSLKTDLKVAQDRMELIPLAISFLVSWTFLTIYLNVELNKDSTCIPKLLDDTPDDTMKRVFRTVMIMGAIISVTDVLVHVSWCLYKKIPFSVPREGLSFMMHYFSSIIVVYLYAAFTGICTKDSSILNKMKDSGIIVIAVYLVSAAIRFSLHLLHARLEKK
jgi:hypothetical protein